MIERGVRGRIEFELSGDRGAEFENEVPAITDEAVVLRLTEYSESSQIATLFSRRAGQVRLIAKGARRGTKTRFAAGLDLLERGDVTYHPAKGDAGLGILASWSQKNSYSGLRRSLESLYAAIYAAEITAGLTVEYDPHEAIFDGLIQLLGRLDAGGTAFGDISAYQRRFLTEIGYVPELSRCMDCGRAVVSWSGMYLSAAAGGLICGDCEMHHVEKRRLPASEVLPSSGGAAGESGREGVHRDSGCIPALSDRDWFEVFDYYISHLAGRPMGSAANLLKLGQSRTR